jgi:exopolysaccharide biosynthesis polyprenyl glycosylphosphotransferase
MRRVLVASDVLALLAAVGVGELIAGHARGTSPTLWHAALSVGAIAITVFVLGLSGLYGRDDSLIDHQTPDDFRTIASTVVAVGFGSLALHAIAGWTEKAALAIVVATIVAAVTVPLLRAVARTVGRRSNTWEQRVLILGAGHVGHLVARKLLQHPEYGLRPIGFIDDNPRSRPSDLASMPVLGSTDRLADIAQTAAVSRVIVAFSSIEHDRALAAITAVRRAGVRVDVVPRLFEAMGPAVNRATIEGLSTITLAPLNPPRPALAIKRAFDAGFAAVALLFMAPLIALIALAIRLDSKGPALYRGQRIGRGGRMFGQLKFRTMYTEMSAGENYGGESAGEFFARLLADPARREEFARTQKLEHDPRVTRVGRFLRRSSLDELPQLWNVLVGDLSLVGPRPITEQERIERYQGDLDLAHRPMGYWDLDAFRPGMTGYWQISGRSRMSFEERIRLDTAYLTGWSLGLDINILAKTLRSLAITSGAY